jgi:membrane-associated phospholipid phosphatase
MSSAAVLSRSRIGFGGAAERLGNHLRRLPSLLVSLLVGSVGAFLLAGLMISLGLFTSRALLSISEIASADAYVPDWLASHRTPFLTDASYVGYMLADAWVLAPLVGAFAVALVLARRWRTATFLVLAALIEVWGYVLTSSFVHWQTTNPVRPASFPWVTFPAGRVAAAIAIYGALAILLSAHFRSWWVRSAFCVLALAVSLAVAASHMYRSEHHLIDVAGGAAMGMGALLVALLAEHVAGIVAELRGENRAGEVAR